MGIVQIFTSKIKESLRLWRKSFLFCGKQYLFCTTSFNWNFFVRVFVSVSSKFVFERIELTVLIPCSMPPDWSPYPPPFPSSWWSPPGAQSSCWTPPSRPPSQLPAPRETFYHPWFAALSCQSKKAHSITFYNSVMSLVIPSSCNPRCWLQSHQ